MLIYIFKNNSKIFFVGEKIMASRIGVDIGGTFTDFICYDEMEIK